jgi:hypothetical protein
VAAVSFFLVLFLSLKWAVEMWKIHGPTELWLRILDPTTRWLTVDVRARAEVREKGMHTQMLSFEDSTIRDAVFPDEVGRERGKKE